jgi:hypothetical protein
VSESLVLDCFDKVKFDAVEGYFEVAGVARCFLLRKHIRTSDNQQSAVVFNPGEVETIYEIQRLVFLVALGEKSSKDSLIPKCAPSTLQRAS